ncbi:hypothetical protein A7P96_01565 [Eikenella sp. NML03-A-027]|uniref:DUF4189 domain-containing protein n=1 Tax=Eikenella sp. NML03-A-027 TaxID=1795828 RepID=UPI0007E1FD32|nr:DUF4189 domain-containing protein [Eikenella sp. NML03-A-027]OAM32881.1 hypothetical protein A7P96_01565 [Eikenella sp. NML03-A-027]
MKQTMMNTAAGVLAAVLLGGAGLAWADGFDPWLADGLNKQIQQNREAQQQPTYSGPTAAEIRAWEQREAEVQAEIAELRRTPFYMAIAYDFDTRQSMWSGGYISEHRAVEETLKQCSSSNCRVIKTFANTCAAVVEPDSRAKSAADIFVALDKDDRQAATKAMHSCEAQHGAGNCSYWQVRKPLCTGYDYSIYGQR